jgi:hypothetical protein
MLGRSVLLVDDVQQHDRLLRIQQPDELVDRDQCS